MLESPPRCQANDIALMIAVVGILIFRASTNTVDPDLWHEMALAREASALGWVPQQDQFSYFPTVSPSVHHEWGAGVIAYYLANLLGGSAIMLIKWALIAGIAMLCWRVCRNEGVSTCIFGMLSVLAVFMSDDGYSTVRAQLYSYFFVAVMLYALQSDRRGRRSWILPWIGVHLLWLNVHAGFLFGSALFFFYWLESWYRREKHLHLLGTGIAMALLIIVNPFGADYLTYLLHATTMPRPRISEWSPIWIAGRPHQIVAFLISIGIVALVVRKRPWTELRGLPLVLITAAYSIKHSRMLPFYAITWLMFVPSYLTATDFANALEQAWDKQKNVMTGIWSMACLLLIIPILNSKAWEPQVLGSEYPVGAVDYLAQQDFSGNVLVTFDDGAYVLWKLHPKVKVSIDSRYEVAYPKGALEDNLTLFRAEPGWESILNRHQTDLVLVPRWLPLEKMLSEDGTVPAKKYKSLYVDDYYALYAVNPKISLSVVNRQGIQDWGSFP